MNHSQEKFKLRVIVPPLGNGKIVLTLRFMDSQYGWRTLIDENNSGKAWHSKSTLTVQDQTAAGGLQPIIHTWEIYDMDLPPDAVQAEARISFDPYGNGKHLLPHNIGMLLSTIKGSPSSESSI